jgi:cytochrome bd-type quinol oxidase subunit 2
MLASIRLTVAATDVPTVTGDRIVASVAAVVALASTIIGVLALVRSARSQTDRNRKLMPAAAVAAAATGLVTGVLVVVTADGGPGTGNGVIGGWAAVVLGLAGAALGGLALQRSGRSQRAAVRTRS